MHTPTFNPDAGYEDWIAGQDQAAEEESVADLVRAFEKIREERCPGLDAQIEEDRSGTGIACAVVNRVLLVETEWLDNANADQSADEYRMVTADATASRLIDLALARVGQRYGSLMTYKEASNRGQTGGDLFPIKVTVPATFRHSLLYNHDQGWVPGVSFQNSFPQYAYLVEKKRTLSKWIVYGSSAFEVLIAAAQLTEPALPQVEIRPHFIEADGIVVSRFPVDPSRLGMDAPAVKS